MKAEKKLQNYRKKVEQFKQDFLDYVETTGDRDLPIIDCSWIGYEEYPEPVIKDLKHGFKVTLDGFSYKVEIKKDEVVGWDGYFDNLKDALAYDQRRLKKAWKIWHSENPDAELEKDDDDEE